MELETLLELEVCIQPEEEGRLYVKKYADHINKKRSRLDHSCKNKINTNIYEINR